MTIILHIGLDSFDYIFNGLYLKKQFLLHVFSAIKLHCTLFNFLTELRNVISCMIYYVVVRCCHVKFG